MKLCATCKKEKDHSEFHKNASRLSGLQVNCKECSYERRSAEYKADPLKYRRAQYKRTYGITLEEAEDMLKSQDGKCPICTGQVSLDVQPRLNRSGAAVVDHCHGSKKVRGIYVCPAILAWGCLKTTQTFY